LEISCELAGIIGPQPVYRPPLADIPALLLGFGVIISVMDMSMVDSFPGVKTDGVIRFATYQCRYSDGCSRIGGGTPIAGGSAALAGATMALQVGDASGETQLVGEYGTSVEEAIAWIADGITLLPGDVVSLGPSKATLTIPAEDRLAPGTTVVASIAGIGEIQVELVDQRDLSIKPWPWPLIPR
jgi:hypothetical protein